MDDLVLAEARACCEKLASPTCVSTFAGLAQVKEDTTLPTLNTEVEDLKGYADAHGISSERVIGIGYSSAPSL